MCTHIHILLTKRSTRACKDRRHWYGTAQKRYLQDQLDYSERCVPYACLCMSRFVSSLDQLAICTGKRERSPRIWTAQRPLSIACLCMSRCVSSSDQLAICIGKRERSLRTWSAQPPLSIACLCIFRCVSS